MNNQPTASEQENVRVSVADESLADSLAYARGFPGQLRLPPVKHVAMVECVDTRLGAHRRLGLKDDEAIHESLRGFLFDVATGKLNEVKP